MLLYSTNTWLAYTISWKFYGERHWVYCAPTFSSTSFVPHAPLQPASSSPKKIYWDLLADVRSNDLHSAKIAQNRAGLKKGALAKFGAGRITEQDAADIAWLVDNASVSDFRPLLYVIPKANVSTRLRRVSPKDAANPFSDEYILEDLAIGEFEAIELH